MGSSKSPTCFQAFSVNKFTKDSCLRGGPWRTSKDGTSYPSKLGLLPTSFVIPTDKVGRDGSKGGVGIQKGHGRRRWDSVGCLGHPS